MSGFDSALLIFNFSMLLILNGAVWSYHSSFPIVLGVVGVASFNTLQNTKEGIRCKQQHYHMYVQLESM